MSEKQVEYYKEKSMDAHKLENTLKDNENILRLESVYVLLGLAP